MKKGRYSEEQIIGVLKQMEGDAATERKTRIAGCSSFQATQ